MPSVDVSANPHAHWPVCAPWLQQSGGSRDAGGGCREGTVRALHEKQGPSFHCGPGGPAPVLLLPGLARRAFCSQLMNTRAPVVKNGL